MDWDKFRKLQEQHLAEARTMIYALERFFAPPAGPRASARLVHGLRNEVERTESILALMK